MIKSFIVTNYLGDSIKIDLRKPEKSGFLIKSVTGLGPAKASINTTELSTYDGALFNSARVSQRNIVFNFQFVDTDIHETIEDLRQKTYRYFPTKKNVEIIIETDNRLMRTIGYVESNDPIIFSSQEGTQISIICPDPFLYSAGEDGDCTTNFFGIESAFEFPFENESVNDKCMILSQIKILSENNVWYAGDSEVGVTLYIYAFGPASDISVSNVTTDMSISINTDKLADFTGNGISAGDSIVITTKKGSKGIILYRNDKAYNILNCLDKKSKWINLIHGDNIFKVSASQGENFLQLAIENKTVYEGV